MSFQNKPNFTDREGNKKIRRWIHPELHIDHYDIHVHMQTSGKVKLIRPVKGTDEYDEIEIPAALIFKLADLMKMTRRAEYVSVTEVPKEELQELKDLKEVDKTS